MNTITAVPPQERRDFWRPSSRAQWAYLAMTGVLLAGFAGIAFAAGAPSMHLGMAVVILAAIAMGVGGLLEKDTITVVAAFLGGITAHMVVVTSTTDRTYSHKTLAGMFLSVVAVLFAAARYTHVRQARQARTGR